MPRIALYCARYPCELLTLRPLGIGYIAAYLIQKGIAAEDDVRIVDSAAEAIAFRPDIVGVSSVSQVIQDAVGFARRCKELTGCFTVLGGYHIAGVPGKLPKEFDAGILGEGEETFAEIAAKFRGNKIKTEDLSGIPGLCYFKDGAVAVNGRRELIKDIDSLPWPHRTKVYSQAEPVFTSRGCPYRCIFCASHEFWRDTYRLRDAESVVSEIGYLVEKFRPREIVVLDDLWISDKKRFREIAAKLKERNIPEKVSFRGFVRSNIVGEEDILLLKEMNYRLLRFGAETGSERLLKRLKGESASVEHHQRVIDLCRKHDMPCAASFMFGIPGETMEDLKATEEFLAKNKGKLGISGFYFFNPVPGTEIWKRMEERKMISDGCRFEALQLDLLRKDFSWENVLYFNQENVPLEDFKEFIADIRTRFIGPGQDKGSLSGHGLSGLLRRFMRKISGKASG